MAKKEIHAEAAKPAGGAAARPEYAMPAVELGDVVLWHADPAEPPVCCAVVTEVGRESVALSLAHKNFFNLEPKDGVRHVGHPDTAIVRTTGEGCWSHTADRLSREARLAELEALVAGSSPTAG